MGGLVITGVFTFKAGAGYKISCMNTKVEVFVIKSKKITKKALGQLKNILKMQWLKLPCRLTRCHFLKFKTCFKINSPFTER